MSRLTIMTKSQAQAAVEGLYRDMERRIIASPPGICPVDLTAAFLRMCMAQTCGKCAPCRIGLKQLCNLLDDILEGRGTEQTLKLLRSTASSVAFSADCALGFEAAKIVLKGMDGYYDDFEAHVTHHRCNSKITQAIPCEANCPAGVDIPGYIALVGAQQYADAVRLIRKDNPFPVACALICEHPCEARCRRTMLDAPVNIRGLKRAAVDNAGIVPAPATAEKTGKKVAIIGGGPSGLSAAYYLQLMGHQCTVFEKRPKLGGMLVYGIPSYRLPREKLQEDIDCILSTGVEVRMNAYIGGNEDQISMEQLRKDYDAVYISIGAHMDRKLGIDGEDAQGVISAVEMLGSIGNGVFPDFKGKKVCIIGGGNVAMDCTRSAIRCGADKVSIVYRRRVDDMTALPEEVQGAIAEGAEMLELCAPLRVETDGQNNVTALWVSPKMVSRIRDGRPGIADSGKNEERVPCDVVIVAVGQAIESNYFAEEGITVARGVIKADEWAGIPEAPGVFAGGDCVTGPATVIRAIAAGKVAANNIDQYLGFHHKISVDVEVPAPNLDDKHYCGRVNMRERAPEDRKHDFKLMECGMSLNETLQEAGRCLRCDHFGLGNFKGGRKKEW